jgi:hypothetical protein
MISEPAELFFIYLVLIFYRCGNGGLHGRIACLVFYHPGVRSIYPWMVIYLKST